MGVQELGALGAVNEDEEGGTWEGGLVDEGKESWGKGKCEDCAVTRTANEAVTWSSRLPSSPRLPSPAPPPPHPPHPPSPVLHDVSVELGVGVIHEDEGALAGGSFCLGLEAGQGGETRLEPRPGPLLITCVCMRIQFH